jgi:polyisoprenoid-binding protein YceI
MMLRRILIGLVALLLIGVLVIVVVIRQIVFGGTPTIHRSATEPVVAASPCATIDASSGLSAFRVVTQQSNASYEAHFLVAGQAVPGTVMGITGDVSGEFLLTADEHPTIKSMRVVVDLRMLDSGAPERDEHVRNDTLEVNKYPYAIFTVMDAQVLPGSYSEGQMVSFKLKGSLTLHGVTRPTTFDMQGQLANDRVMGSATTLIHLQDFHMKTPMTTAAVTITVSKDITLTVRYTGQRESCTHLS